MDTTFVDKVKKQNYSFFHIDDNIVDENDDMTKYAIRGFRDKSTDAYVLTYFQDKDIFEKFIDFTFNYLSQNLVFEINNKLISMNNQPIINNENVEMLFKGGNIMNKYFSLYKNAVQKVNDINIDDISKNFKLSDVDYGIIISNMNYKRHFITSNIIIDILSERLNYITSLYDFLLENRNDVNAYRKILNKQRINYPEYRLNGLMNIEIYNSLKNIQNELRKQIETNNIDVNLIKTTNDIINSIEANKQINILELNLLVEIIQLIDYILPNPEYKKIMTKYNDLIRDIITQKKIEIIQKNQYNSVPDLDSLKTKIADLLNEDEINKFRYEKIKDDITRIKITSNVDKNDINIERRKNVIVSFKNNINELTEVQELPPNKYHYLSLNSSVFGKKKNNVIVQFNLLRTKINIILDEKKIEKQKNKNGIFANDKNNSDLKIPSEFIDISIVGYQDSILSEINKHHELFSDKYLTFNNSNIKVYSASELIFDLELVLFVQNYYCPWIDKKYKKRIIRLSWFLVFNSHVNNNKEKNKIDTILTASKKILDNITNKKSEYIQEFDVFLKKNNSECNLDFLKYLIKNKNLDIFISDDYILYFPLLRCLIINYVLLSFNNDELIYEFIIQMRNNYMFSTKNMDDKEKVINEHILNFIEFVTALIQNLELFKLIPCDLCDVKLKNKYPELLNIKDNKYIINKYNDDINNKIAEKYKIINNVIHNNNSNSNSNNNSNSDRGINGINNGNNRSINGINNGNNRDISGNNNQGTNGIRNNNSNNDNDNNNIGINGINRYINSINSINSINNNDNEFDINGKFKNNADFMIKNNNDNVKNNRANTNDKLKNNNENIKFAVKNNDDIINNNVNGNIDDKLKYEYKINKYYDKIENTIYNNIIDKLNKEYKFMIRDNDNKIKEINTQSPYHLKQSPLIYVQQQPQPIYVQQQPIYVQQPQQICAQPQPICIQQPQILTYTQ
jgi:hypothetical protein